jgi:undecaprenyl-diphosphatase
MQSVFFALSTSIYLLSHKVGIIAYCHAFFIVSLPRIYTGIHYPTDIIAGALLGIAIALLFSVKNLRSVLTRFPMYWLERSPASFYPCFYVAAFLIATNFDPLRRLLVSAWHAVHQ